MSQRRSGRRATVWVGAALCVLTAGSRQLATFSLFAEQTDNNQRPTISVASNLVVLPVRVFDARGTFVSGLNISNFAVFEDGKPQRISLFRQEDSPITVGLLIDHSGSMSGKLSQVAAAAETLARSGNTEDEMFVVNFGDGVSVPSFAGKLFTADPSAVQKSIEDTSAQGRTALYDAIATGLNRLRAGSHQRKALVIVSDGGDDASRMRYREIRQLARESQAAIYAIALVGGPYKEQNPSILRALAQETGGVAYFPSAINDVGSISVAIARDLREQYILGYEPQLIDASHGFRKIEVRARGPKGDKLQARTRSGYLPISVDGAPSAAREKS